MKKVCAILLALAIVLSLCACSDSNTNLAESNEVKSYLMRYYWYHFVGGYYDMSYIYEFESDGTCTLYTAEFSSIKNSYDLQYKIDPQKDTVTFINEDGNKVVWTYTLHNGSLKLFNNKSKEYFPMEKD